MNIQPEPIPEILADPHVSPESKAALSIPHEFQRRLDSQWIKQERRKLLAVPAQPSAFLEFTA